MPFFNKKMNCSESGSNLLLNDRDRRFLRTCRTLLVKELDVFSIVQAMNIDETHKHDFLEVTTCTNPSLDYQASLFLDKLEQKSDKVLQSFLEVLAYHYKPIYNLYESEIKREINDNLIETDNISTDVTGEEVSKMINNKRKFVNSSDTLDNSKEDGINETFEYPKELDLTNSSKKTIGFTLASKYISNYTRPQNVRKCCNSKLKSSSKSSNSREVVELNEDIVVRKIDFGRMIFASQLDTKHKLKPFQTCYIFERELIKHLHRTNPLQHFTENPTTTTTLAINSNNNSPHKQDDSIKSTETNQKADGKTQIRGLKPPPVPPKPKNLPHLAQNISYKYFKFSDRHDNAGLYPADGDKLKLTKYSKIPDDLILPPYHHYPVAATFSPSPQQQQQNELQQQQTPQQQPCQPVSWQQLSQLQQQEQQLFQQQQQQLQLHYQRQQDDKNLTTTTTTTISPVKQKHDEDIKPIYDSSNLSDEIWCKSKEFKNDEDSGGHGDNNDEENELNYNVSICSMSELCSSANRNNSQSHASYELERFPFNSSYSKEKVVPRNEILHNQGATNDSTLSETSKNLVEASVIKNQIVTSTDDELFLDRDNYNSQKQLRKTSVKKHSFGGMDKNLDLSSELSREVLLKQGNCNNKKVETFSGAELTEGLYSDTHYEYIKQIDESLNCTSPHAYLDPRPNFYSETFLDKNSSDDIKVLPKSYLLIEFEKDLSICIPPVKLNSFSPNSSSQNPNNSSGNSSGDTINTGEEDRNSDVTITSLLNKERDSKTVSSKSTIVASPEDKATEETDLMKSFCNISLVYDKDGSPLFIPDRYLSKHKDQTKEPWWYPIPLSPHQASLFLESSNQNGCFIVYKPLLSVDDDDEDEHSNVFMLSVLSSAEHSVLHYTIVENSFGDFCIENHTYSFLYLSDLVEYFRHNKSMLATRLRRPLKYAHFPVTAGMNYDAALELPRQNIFLTEDILIRDKSARTVTCIGKLTDFTPRSNLNLPPNSSQSNFVAVIVSGAFAKNDYHSREDDDDFVDQANVMAGLDHANVLKLLGVSFKLRPLFIVTELFSCRSLKEALWNNDVDQNVCNLFSICLQITSAMAYLESQKFIIVRNLSAKSFVMCEPPPDSSCGGCSSHKATVKLINFTKARRVVDDSYVGDLSESVNVKRSSLEVLDGCNYSSKSDVWSAGVVMWEVFNEGEKPYIGLSPELVIRFVFQGGRLSKPALCPSDLFDVIHKCWLPQPKNRPSFQQLKSKLAGKSSVYLYPPRPFEKPSFSPDCPSFKSPPIGSRGKSVDRLGLVNTRVNIPLPSHPPPLSSHLFKTAMLPSSFSLQMSADNSNQFDPNCNNNFGPRNNFGPSPNKNFGPSNNSDPDNRRNLLPNLPKSSSENSLIAFPTSLSEELRTCGCERAAAAGTRSDKLRKSFQKIMKKNRGNSNAGNNNNSSGNNTNASTYTINSTCSRLSVKSET